LIEPVACSLEQNLALGGISFFIRAHDETLSVAAMCVSNPDCSPARING
jgi:hypothetical protein